MIGRTDQKDSGSIFYNNLEGLKGRKDPQALKAAAKEMEALFAYEMIKAMRETVKTSQNSFGGNVYMSMFDMEIAKQLSSRGLGMAELIERGLTRGENIGDKTSNKELSTQDTEPLKTDNVENKKPLKKAGISIAESVNFLANMPEQRDGDVNMPVDGRISSGYGMRKHPIYGDSRLHKGVDIAAAKGANIYPFRKGRVVFSGEQQGYGNVVIIEHGDGLVTKYAHNKENLVKAGDKVDLNTVIAQVGSTGMSTGPHLHFEIKYNGKNINPIDALAEGQG